MAEEEFSITKSKRWTIQKLEPFLLIRPQPEEIDLSKPSQKLPQKSRVGDGTSNFMPRKKGSGIRGRPTQSGQETSVFGCFLSDIRPRGGLILPLIIVQCVEYIRKHCLKLQGIFRISGVKSHIDAVERKFVDPNTWVDLESCVEDHHVVACILKKFLRDTPEPLFPYSIWDELLQIYQGDDENITNQYFNVLKNIHPFSLTIIVYIFSFLNALRQYSESNLMAPQNLGIVFGPGLLRPKSTDPRMLLEGWDGNIVEQLIENYDAIFPRLGTISVEGKWGDDYGESLAGYIAMALRPRFSVSLARNIGDKKICKCEYITPQTDISSAPLAFNIGVTEGMTCTEFLDQVLRRGKEIAGDFHMAAHLVTEEETRVIDPAEKISNYLLEQNSTIEIRASHQKMIGARKKMSVSSSTPASSPPQRGCSPPQISRSISPRNIRSLCGGGGGGGADGIPPARSRPTSIATTPNAHRGISPEHRSFDSNLPSSVTSTNSTRFLVTFSRTIGTKIICQCKLIMTEGGDRAHSFTIALEEPKLSDLIEQVTKRAKDIVGTDRLKAFTISKSNEGSVRPLKQEAPLLPELQDPEKILELRVIPSQKFSPTSGRRPSPGSAIHHSEKSKKVVIGSKHEGGRPPLRPGRIVAPPPPPLVELSPAFERRERQDSEPNRFSVSEPKRYSDSDRNRSSGSDRNRSSGSDPKRNSGDCAHSTRISNQFLTTQEMKLFEFQGEDGSKKKFELPQVGTTISDLVDEIGNLTSVGGGGVFLVLNPTGFFFVFSDAPPPLIP